MRPVVLGCLSRQVPGKSGEPEADADTDGRELGTEGLGGKAAHEREYPRSASKKPLLIVECRETAQSLQRDGSPVTAWYCDGNTIYTHLKAHPFLVRIPRHACHRRSRPWSRQQISAKLFPTFSTHYHKRRFRRRLTLCLVLFHTFT